MSNQSDTSHRTYLHFNNIRDDKKALSIDGTQNDESLLPKQAQGWSYFGESHGGP